MPSDYMDELRKQAMQTASGQVDYMETLRQQAKDLTAANMSATVSQAAAVNPDQYAKQRDIAGRMGVPPAVVEALPNEMATRDKLKKVQDDAAVSPVLQRKYSEADFAKLAHDDSGVLSSIAAAAKWLVSAPGNQPKLIDSGAGEFIGTTIKSGLLALPGALATIAESANPFTTSEKDLAVLYKNDPAKLKDTLDNSANSFLYRVSRSSQQASDVAMGELSPEAKAAFGNLRYSTLEEGKSAWRNPVKVIGDAFQSLPTSLAMAVSMLLAKGAGTRALAQAEAEGLSVEAAKAAATAATVSMMAKVSAGSEGAVGYAQQLAQTREAADKVTNAQLSLSEPYKDLIAKGYDPQVARTLLSAVSAEEAGQVAGIVDAAVNFVGGRFLGKIIGEGGRPLVSTVKGIATEGATEFVQSPGEQLGQNLALKQNMNPTQDLTEDLLESALAGLAVGGFTGGAFGRINARNAKQEAAATVAEQHAQVLEAIQKTMEASKTLERSPETMQTYMQELADEGVPNVYVDSAELVKAGVDLQALAQVVPSVAAQLDQVQTGGDLVIPTGELLTNTIGTEYSQALIDHARTDVDGMSRSEAKVYMQEQGDQINKQIERALGEKAADAEFKASRDALKDEILAKLNELGRFTPKVNEHQAMFLSTLYAVEAAKLGMTPQALAQKYQLNYEGAPGQSSYDQRTIAQGRIRRTIDELVQAAESQKTWKDWYNRHETTLLSMFGSDADLFQKILSATSQATGVKGNVTLALKAYDQLHAGLPFEGYLPAVIKNLERIRNEEKLAGAKISQYGEANEGNTEAIAVDRHIAMLFFNTKSPSKAQIESAKDRIRKVAERLKWEPRQVQAALWAFNQVRLGTDPSKVESYDKILEARADFIAALRAKHGRGEGGGVQAGGSTVQGDATGGTFAQSAKRLSDDILDEGGQLRDVAPVDQLIDSKLIPTITLQDLVGKKIFPTIADRTAAAALYTGIDSSQINISIPLLGGPFFPLRQSNSDAGLVWSNRGEGVTSQKAAKLKEGANYMLVVLGDANMHQSNTTVNNAFFATLEAYIRDGRITPENAEKLTQMVVESKNSDKKIAEYMAEFPGLSDVQKFDEYLHKISFEARSRILEIMGSKAALSLGAPSMSKILDATREPSLAGYNWGDGVLLLEVDQESMMVDLGTNGTMAHPDYPLGIKGKVVGRLKNSINHNLLWQDWLSNWKSAKIEGYDFTQTDKVKGKSWDAKLKAVASALKKGTLSEQAAGMLEEEFTARKKAEEKKTKGFLTAKQYDAKRADPKDRDSYISKLNPRRAFELAKPIVDVKQDLVDRIGPINHANIEGPRQAELAVAFAADNWRTSDSAVNKGGVSQQEYLDAISNSPASAALSEYTPEQVKADVKAGKMRVLQLGNDGQIFFALKYGNPGYESDYGIKIPEIGENEVTLTSVINNEQGARGIAGPAVILKALEEGATVLDCFAVKNGNNPKGFLPKLYARYGFKAVAEVPFNPEFYTPQKLADAVKYWKESTPGYDPEVHGYPPLVIMKWEGTDEQRAGIRERYLRGGIESILERGDQANVAESEANLLEHDRGEVERGGTTSDVGGVAGDQGHAPRSVPSSAELAVRDIANLSDNELTNLGLTQKDRDAVRSALGLPQYNQAEPGKGPRGQIVFGNDISKQASLMRLLKNADLSTFAHETGHFFLEMRSHLAGQIAGRINDGEMVSDGERSILDDMNKMLDWMGVKATPELSALDHWASMSVDEKRPYHEKWARATEAYLFEGKAPSLELQSMFQTFRSWLVNVYRQLLKSVSATKTDIGNALDVELSDEVRGVMDRMLATTAQIEEAEAARSMGPLFKTAEEAGMDMEAFKLYHDMGVQSTQDAIDDLQARSLKDMQWLQNARSRKLKELQKKHDAIRAQIAREVKAEVMSQPIYQVWQFLTAKENQVVPGVTNTDNVDTTQASGRLRTEVLRQMYGTEADAIWRKLSDLHMTSDVTGMHPDIVAEMFGMSSGDELVKTLASTEDPRHVIDAMTDMRMLQEHGDLATPEGLQRAADQAVHNDARLRFVATELRALQHAMSVREKVPGKKHTVDVLVKAAKEHAAAVIAKLKIRDIRPAQYAAAEARSAKAAEKSKADLAEAATHKRNQLVNMYATKSAYAAQEEVAKAVEYLRKFDTKAMREKLPADYLAQIEMLLDKYDLRQQSNAAIDRTVALRTWVQSRLNAGELPVISESLLSKEERAIYEAAITARDEEGNLVYPDDEERIKLLADAIERSEKRSYKEMTVEELRGLRDTVKQIEHLGRLKDKLLTARDGLGYAAKRDQLVKAIVDNAKSDGKNVRSSNTWIGKRLDGLKAFGASHIKPAIWMRIFDGGQDAGAWWSTIVRPANERAAFETTRRAEATAHLMEVLGPVLKNVSAMDKLGKGQFFPELGTSLNWEERFAIAANYGNESNLQRLMGGGIAGVTQTLSIAQIHAVLKTLSTAEWQAVQAVWDHFETYRPEIAAKELRVTGVEPQWIAARPFSITTSDGDTLNLAGGYYPVKFDPKTSLKAQQHADSQAAKDVIKAAYSVATTQRSFTKSRVEEVTGRPLLLNLQGLYSGVNDVIHDLAWHEWVIDMNTLMRSESIDEAIREHYGPNVKRELTKWRDDIVAGSARLDHGIENAAGWARKFVSSAALTYNVMSAILQPLGITQSFSRVGTKWVGIGIGQYLSGPIEATEMVREQSEFMRNRTRTMFRDINELRNRVAGQTTARELMGRYGYFLTMHMQMMVDVPTWIGAHEKALAEGHDEATAIALADQSVKDSQGGGEEVDQAGITRGGPMVKLFTAFYDFMNTQANTLYLKGATSKSKADAFMHFAMVGLATPILAAALKDALTPGDSGDWDDWRKILKKMLAEGLQNLIGMVAFGREFTQVAKALMGEDKGMGYSGPTGLRVIPDAYKLAKQINQGEMDDAFRKAFLNMLGDVSGIPSVQINRTVTGAEALKDHKTSNPAALVFGYQEPH